MRNKNQPFLRLRKLLRHYQQVVCPLNLRQRTITAVIGSKPPLLLVVELPLPTAQLRKPHRQNRSALSATSSSWFPRLQCSRFLQIKRVHSASDLSSALGSLPPTESGPRRSRAMPKDQSYTASLPLRSIKTLAKVLNSTTQIAMCLYY